MVNSPQVCYETSSKMFGRVEFYGWLLVVVALLPLLELQH